MSELRILNYANILEDFTNVTFEEWQAKRQVQLGLGGSDAGTIIGENKFKDEYTLYLEKLGEIPSSQAGEAAEWGHILEPVVAARWLEKVGNPNGMVIENFNYLLQSKTHEFMLANIDRLIRKGDTFGILECKTASEYLKGEWEQGEILSDGSGNGKVPKKYYAQFQHYLHVTGLDWGYFAALVGGNKFYSVYVERNDEYIAWLLEQEMKFWLRLEMRIPPELNGSETCKQLIGVLYPKVEDDNALEIDDSEFGDWITTRNFLKEQIDTHKTIITDLETQCTELENKMKFTIGTNKAVKWNEFVVTWGERAGRTSVDSKLLQEKYPEIYKEVVKQGESYRQLSIAKPKPKKKKGA